MGRHEDYLFSTYDLRKVMENTEQKMYSEIDQVDSKRLMNTSTDDLAKYFIDKNTIEPIAIVENSICVDQSETKIDVSRDPNRFIFDRSSPFYITGTIVTLEVPFVGKSDLFKCQPSSFTLNPPRGGVQGNILFLTVPTTNHDAEHIKRELTSLLDSIKKYLEWIKSDLEPWITSLPSKARSRIEARKNKILKDQGLVASLGFPMKKREDSPVTYVTPEIRRKIQPSMPSASIAPYKPEPAIALDEYENIISVIKLTAKMLERNPQTFKNMGEEELRNQFLVPLNSHYEGQATGETFNFNGKTDILIRSGDRSVFIAECKIWHGQKALLDAIDQLLGYASWRDTKTSLIIFNRNKDLTNTLKKIPEIVLSHPNCKKQLQYQDETGFRFILGHKDDMNREIVLTVLMFEVPI